MPMIVEHALVSGSGKGPKGWFRVTKANVSVDHPFNFPEEHALNIDFVSDELGLDSRIAVELSPDSARRLVNAINSALVRGEEEVGLR